MRALRMLMVMSVFLLTASCTKPTAGKPQLIVQRQDPLHNLSEPKFYKTIDNVEQIEKIEKLIRNLPTFPGGMHCPMDNGVRYNLSFTNTFEDKIVIVAAMGCQQVEFDSKEYWGMEPMGNGFRPYLLKILGLSEKDFNGFE